MKQLWLALLLVFASDHAFSQNNQVYEGCDLLGQPTLSGCDAIGPASPPSVAPAAPQPPPPQVEVVTPDALSGPTDIVDPQSFFIVQVPPGDVLNMRTSPDANSPLVGVLQNNTGDVRISQMVELPSGAKWAMACHGSTCGWVNARYLAPQAGDAGLSLRVVNVASWDFLNMRSEPSATSQIVGAIPPNSVGVVWKGRRAQNGNTQWMLVEYGGAEGWVNAIYVAQ